MGRAVLWDPRLTLSGSSTVHLHLPTGMRARVAKREDLFLGHLTSVLENAGLSVEICDRSLASQLASTRQDGFALFYQSKPEGSDALVFRKNYVAPFWQIADRQDRWNWPVAKAQFDPAAIDPVRAKRFAEDLRSRHFKDVATCDDGFIYAPLQGRLAQHRSFQTCSPLQMLEQLLEHDPKRPVIATLHPGEHYTNLEREELDKIVARHDRLSLSAAPMTALLPRCSYVACQNSSVAFSGFILGKPAALFGRIDFHHIAATVHNLGPRDAIRSVPDLKPNYAAYLFWFLQLRSINAKRPNAPKRIARRLSRYGWPV